jgi:hypothetical protein
MPVVKSKYLQRVHQAIVPRSEANNVKEAIKEWFFNGQSEDHDEPVATCELRSNHGLRYRYQIENRLNQNRLWVGSKCIEKFHMPTRDENGTLLDWPATPRKLKDQIAITVSPDDGAGK